MLASRKPGSAAAREREGDGEDRCGDAIGSPFTASARSRRNCSILSRIVLKSSAARRLVRTTMPGSKADDAGKNQTMRLGLIAALLPPPDGAPLGPPRVCREVSGFARCPASRCGPARAGASIRRKRRRHGHHVQPGGVLPRVDKDEESYQRFERSSCGGFDPSGPSLTNPTCARRADSHNHTCRPPSCVST